jgi:hypothetical protein
MVTEVAFLKGHEGNRERDVRNTSVMPGYNQVPSTVRKDHES